MIENARALDDQFEKYQHDATRNLLIILIDAGAVAQRRQIPYIHQLIDSADQAWNRHDGQPSKYFLVLIHSPAQDLYHQSFFPTIFLHQWDFHFFDTCAAGSAFHLQKMLQILASSSIYEQEADPNEILCDLRVLYEDCLWDICSRAQIILPELPEQIFTSKQAYEFYRPETSLLRRVQCFKEILHKIPHVEQFIMNIYHENLQKTENSSKQIFDFVYQISKEILAGKRLDGLVNSVQNHTRSSLTNFLSHILKILVTDYGLETLSKLSSHPETLGKLLNLIDFQALMDKNDGQLFSSSISQGSFVCMNHYACIPQTPLFYLLHQRMKSHAEAIRQQRMVQGDQHQGKCND